MLVQEMMERRQREGVESDGEAKKFVESFEKQNLKPLGKDFYPASDV